jgi:hypothetical protein
MLLRRDAAYVTSAILPIRNVNLTLLLIDRIVLILKAELFLRTTGILSVPMSASCSYCGVAGFVRNR